MKKFVVACLVTVLAAGLSALAAEEKKPETGTTAEVKKAGEDQPQPFKSKEEKVSYCIGVRMGQSLKRQLLGLELDLDLLNRGVRDGIGGAPLLNEAEMNAFLREFQQEMMKKETERRKVLGERNKKEGEEFLTKNAQKEGVKVLASGLQYKVLKEGAGKAPQPTDTVTVNYVGTLINGTEFDNSYKRGMPATFRANAVIGGWKEALTLMPVGSKWQLFIPSSLAYGEGGTAGEIGPNAVLIFELELISIKEAPATPPAPTKG